MYRYKDKDTVLLSNKRIDNDVLLNDIYRYMRPEENQFGINPIYLGNFSMVIWDSNDSDISIKVKVKIK